VFSEKNAPGTDAKQPDGVNCPLFYALV